MASALFVYQDPVASLCVQKNCKCSDTPKFFWEGQPSCVAKLIAVTTTKGLGASDSYWGQSGSSDHHRVEYRVNAKIYLDEAR